MEVPRQMTDYFIQKNIKPNAKMMKDQDEIRVRNAERNKIVQIMGCTDDYYGMRKK